MEGQKQSKKEGEKVWFITGASRGLGRAFMEYALQKGYNVVAALRTPDMIAHVVKHASVKQLLVVKLDVNNRTEIQEAIKAALEKFGHIDVLINNAGYNLIGPIEEATEEQFREQFETNFFGQVAIIKALLPVMREQGYGDIVQVSSVRGSIGDPGAGVYTSSKFALDGLCESLSNEVAPFGIRVVIVKPGAFRTDVNNPEGNLTFTPDSGIYKRDNPASQIKESVVPMHGKQPGDPYRAAVALDRALSEPSPPLHLLMGSDCFDAVQNKLYEQEVMYKTWEELSRSTDFPEEV